MAPNEDDNLATYSLWGSYARQALKWASNASVESGFQSGQQIRAGELDWSSVYRDQIYWLDGSSSAAVVPRSLYAASPNWSQPLEAPSGERPSETPFVFGRKQTVSFWMRHKPFKFARQSANESAKLNLDELAKHVKEHLLCSSSRSSSGQDPDEAQHKHHYALFVRNCKLNLLVRRHLDWSSKALNDSSGAYLPTEWRWQLPEVCDNKWHLYSVNLNYPNAELYVDGAQFEESYDNLLIVDDLPLLSSTSGQLDDESSSVLSVGACWDSRQQDMSGHFRGYLSGLNVLAGSNDDSQTLECLGRCTESLQLSPQTSSSSLLMQDMSLGRANNKPSKPDNSLISYQESQSKILLNGHDLLDVEDALTQVAYNNWRSLPSPGKRLIRINTKLECQQQQLALAELQGSVASSTLSLPVEPLRVELNVLPSKSLPVISISGQSNLQRESGSLLLGVRLFASIQIRIKRLNLEQISQQQVANNATSTTFHNQTQPELPTRNNNSNSTRDTQDYIEDSSYIQDESKLEPAELSTTKRRIEACSVRVQPPLNGLHESLILPLEQLNKLQLYWRQSHEGFTIYGLDSANNYRHLLGLVQYRNLKSAYYLKRVFVLLCSDLNGRLVSNEYLQTVSIVGRPERVASKSPVQRLRFASEPELRLESSLEQVAGKHLPLTMLDLEQSTKLDRIAMAFLVFVVSLVVIMLVISLTNLKEPNQNSSSKVNRHQEDKFSLSYDIDSPPADYLEESECRFGSSGRSRRANCSAANTDLESLAWDDENGCDEDDEQLEESDELQPPTSIVMNPLLHNHRPSLASMIARQVPGGGRASSHLSLEPSLVVSGSDSGSCSSSSSTCGEQDDHEQRSCRHLRGGRLGAPSVDEEFGEEDQEDDQDDEEDDSEHYELYHQHHFHHSCIKQGRLDASGNSSSSSSCSEDEAHSNRCR